MFKEKTVIVLGAGSSAEFGLPTGREIFNHISVPKIPSTEQHREEIYDKYSTFGTRFTKFYKDRIGGSSELDKLLKLGRQGYHESIDQLAIRNPSLIKQAKQLSAWCILSKICFNKTETIEDAYSEHVPKKIQPTFTWRNSQINGERNWVGAIVAKYLEAGIEQGDLLQNNLSIVSFNYDTLFEDAFWHFLRQDEVYYGVSENCGPKIVHVFGAFPPVTSNLNHGSINQYAEMIKFMGEENDLQLQRIEKATSYIADAEKVLLIGFDCHPKNMELIKLTKASADIYAINYDGNPNLHWKLTEELGMPEEHIMSGTFENPIGVSQSFAKGFLAFPDRFSQYSNPSIMVV